MIEIGLVIEDIVKTLQNCVSDREMEEKRVALKKEFLSKLITKDKLKIKKAVALLDIEEEILLNKYFALSDYNVVDINEILKEKKIVSEEKLDREIELIIEKINNNIKINSTKQKKN